MVTYVSSPYKPYLATIYMFPSTTFNEIAETQAILHAKQILISIKTCLTLLMTSGT